MMEEANTPREMLELWDAGKSIWTIEMGGIGPGYEQAIQILMVEIIRDEIDKPLPTDKNWRTWGDATVKRIDYQLPDGKWSCGGFSGAQIGAAKQLAYSFLQAGVAATLAHVADQPGRKILASNIWPRVIPQQEPTQC